MHGNRREPFSLHTLTKEVIHQSDALVNSDSSGDTLVPVVEVSGSLHAFQKRNPPRLPMLSANDVEGSFACSLLNSRKAAIDRSDWYCVIVER